MASSKDSATPRGLIDAFMQNEETERTTRSKTRMIEKTPSHNPKEEASTRKSPRRRSKRKSGTSLIRKAQMQSLVMNHIETGRQQTPRTMIQNLMGEVEEEASLRLEQSTIQNETLKDATMAQNMQSLSSSDLDDSFLRAYQESQPVRRMSVRNKSDQKSDDSLPSPPKKTPRRSLLIMDTHKRRSSKPSSSPRRKSARRSVVSTSEGEDNDGSPTAIGTTRSNLSKKKDRSHQTSSNESNTEAELRPDKRMRENFNATRNNLANLVTGEFESQEQETSGMVDEDSFLSGVDHIEVSPPQKSSREKKSIPTKGFAAELREKIAEVTAKYQDPPVSPRKSPRASRRMTRQSTGRNDTRRIPESQEVGESSDSLPDLNISDLSKPGQVDSESEFGTQSTPEKRDYQQNSNVEVLVDVHRSFGTPTFTSSHDEPPVAGSPQRDEEEPASLDPAPTDDISDTDPNQNDGAENRPEENVESADEDIETNEVDQVEEIDDENYVRDGNTEEANEDIETNEVDQEEIDEENDVRDGNTDEADEDIGTNEADQVEEIDDENDGRDGNTDEANQEVESRRALSDSDDEVQDGFSLMKTPVLHKARQTTLDSFVGRQGASPAIFTEPRTAVKRPSALQQMRKKIATEKKAAGLTDVKKIKLPTSLTKSIVQHFSRHRVSKETVEEIEKVADVFWKHAVQDLSAFAKHAKRQGLEESDVELLMRRQGFVSETKTLHSLVRKYLPLEYVAELIPIARAGNQVIPKM